MTDDTHRPPAHLDGPRSDERRRHPRYATDLRATVRIGAGAALFGRLVNLSQGGACIEFPRAVRGRLGEWVVLDGDRPLRNGYDATIVGVDNRRWHLAFDPNLVELAIFKSVPPANSHGAAAR
jgi:hypothetical protein